MKLNGNNERIRYVCSPIRYEAELGMKPTFSDKYKHKLIQFSINDNLPVFSYGIFGWLYQAGFKKGRNQIDQENVALNEKMNGR